MGLPPRISPHLRWLNTGLSIDINASWNHKDASPSVRTSVTNLVDYFHSLQSSNSCGISTGPFGPSCVWSSLSHHPWSDMNALLLTLTWTLVCGIFWCSSMADCLLYAKVKMTEYYNLSSDYNKNGNILTNWNYTQIDGKFQMGFLC